MTERERYSNDYRRKFVIDWVERPALHSRSAHTLSAGSWSLLEKRERSALISNRKREFNQGRRNEFEKRRGQHLSGGWLPLTRRGGHCESERGTFLQEEEDWFDWIMRVLMGRGWVLLTWRARLSLVEGMLPLTTEEDFFDRKRKTIFDWKWKACAYWKGHCMRLSTEEDFSLHRKRNLEWERLVLNTPHPSPSPKKKNQTYTHKQQQQTSKQTNTSK